MLRYFSYFKPNPSEYINTTRSKLCTVYKELFFRYSLRKNAVSTMFTVLIVIKPNTCCLVNRNNNGVIAHCLVVTYHRQMITTLLLVSWFSNRVLSHSIWNVECWNVGTVKVKLIFKINLDLNFFTSARTCFITIGFI